MLQHMFQDAEGRNGLAAERGGWIVATDRQGN